MGEVYHDQAHSGYLRKGIVFEGCGAAINMSACCFPYQSIRTGILLGRSKLSARTRSRIPSLRPYRMRRYGRLPWERRTPVRPPLDGPMGLRRNDGLLDVRRPRRAPVPGLGRSMFGI